MRSPFGQRVGRDLAQSRDGGEEGPEEALHLTFSGVFAGGNPEGGERFVLAAPHRQQDRGGFVAGGAGGEARAATDGVTEGVEVEHEALGLDTLDAEVDAVGEPFLGVAVETHPGEASSAGDQGLPQSLFVARSFLHLLRGESGRRPETGYPRDVLRTAPEALLLSAAEDERGDLYALPGVQGAHALRAIDLVCRDGQRGDWHPRDVYRQTPGCLDRVHVQRHPRFGADSGDLLDGLHGADLVVSPHDRREGRLGAQALGELGWVHDSVLVDADPGYLVALRLKVRCRAADGRVLDRGEDNVPLLRIRSGQAQHRQVVSLGAAGGKQYLPRPGAYQSRHPGTGLLYGIAGGGAQRVQGGGVAPQVRAEQVRQHSLEDPL